MSGELERAIELLPDPSVADGNPGSAGALLAERAHVMLSAGREEAARAEFDRLVALGTHNLTAFGHFYNLGCLDTAGAVLGDDDWVRRAYDEYTSYAETADDRLRVTPLGRGFDVVKGSLALRLDRVDEADQHYRDGLEWAARERCFVEAGRCHQGLAEVAERRGDHALASQQLKVAADLFSGTGATLYLDQVHERQGALRAARGNGRPSYPDGLSAREVEVLQLVAAGESNRKIGERLVIAPGTVANHVRNILAKTKTANRAQASTYAVQQGLVDG
jgi:DNA-binding CsgD family transcriptional regulator